MFAIDLRALAAFRVALGLVLLLDLCSRVADLGAHYSDAGVLPRSAAERLFLQSPWSWSLHALGGSSAFQATLFGLALLAAAALLVGAWTRLATAISWLLLASLHARNPMLLFGADHLLRMLLFWSMFLPLGARGSVDSAQSADTGAGRHLSVASAALLLQPAFMYVFAGIFKLNESWTSGEALRSALRLEMFAKPLGARLAVHPETLALLGSTVPWMEIGLGMVLFSPWRTALLRGLALPLLAGFHLAISLLLETGLFQVLSLSALLLFVPGQVWDRLWPSRRPVRARLTPASTGVLSDTKAVLVGLLLLYVLVWNLATLDARSYTRAHLVEWMSEGDDGSFHRRLLLPGYAVERRLGLLGWIGRSAHLYQQWNLFERGGGERGGWHVVAGTLEDGREVDVLLEHPLAPTALSTHPTDAGALYPGIRWRVYFKYLMQAEQARPLLPGVLARRWERAHPESPLHELEVLFLQRPRDPAQAAPEVAVWFRGAP